MSVAVKWVIVVGNPIDGLRLYGPFDDSDEAGSVAETWFGNDEWWLARVADEPPTVEASASEGK